MFSAYINTTMMPAHAALLVLPLIDVIRWKEEGRRGCEDERQELGKRG